MHISSLLSYILCVMLASSVLCMRAYLHVPPYMRVRMRTRVRTCVRMPMRLPMDVAMRVLVAMRVHAHVWDVSCACMGCLIVSSNVFVFVSLPAHSTQTHTHVYIHTHTHMQTQHTCVRGLLEWAKDLEA